MTRAQRADALLSMAADWQMDEAASAYEAAKRARISFGDAFDLCQSIYTNIFHPGFIGHMPLWASAALSTVSGMGYDLEGADGRPVEHVISFAPCGGVRRQDGSEFAIYRAVRP